MDGVLKIKENNGELAPKVPTIDNSILIKNWGLIAQPGDWACTPELATYHLVGEVYGHPKTRHYNGKRVTTSNLIGKRGDIVITSNGNSYQLGDIDPKYEALYPNAKDRLYKSLPELSK